MIFEKRATKTTYTPDQLGYYLTELDKGSTYSGVDVTVDSSLALASVYACVRVIAETVATLPLKIYKTLNTGGKQVAPNHWLYPILHDQPNEWQTSVEWMEMSTAHTVLYGNAYSQIARGGDGRVKALWPLNPPGMKVERKGSVVTYKYTDSKGNETTLSSKKVLHIGGLHWDSDIVGISPVKYLKNSMGLTDAGDKMAGKQFGSGARFSGMLKFPGKFKTDQKKREAEESFKEAYAGTDNAFEIPILEQGMDFVQTSMSNEDAQFIESRKFQIEEMARIFRVPLFMIQDTEKSTTWGTGIEHLQIAFVTYTIVPWLKRIEQAIQRDLDPGPGFFAEFLVDGLLRGDAKSRSEALQVQFLNGSLTPNEWREIENRNPSDNPAADELYTQMQNQPLGTEPQAPPAFGEENSFSPDGETRADIERRTIAARLKVRENHIGAFLDGFQRLVKREVNDLRKASQRLLGERNTLDMREFLDKFYKDFERPVREVMKPLVLAFARSMQQAIGGEWDASMDTAVQDYIRSLVVHLTHDGRGQMTSLTYEERPDEAIDERLSSWDETRAEKYADREIVRAGEEIVAVAFAGMGYSRKKWRAAPNACPLCKEMHGSIVMSGEAFMEKGDGIAPEGVSPYQAKRTIKTPPLHGGCVCLAMPEV